MKYYPEGTKKILEFYEGEFEACFILVHPFLRIENEKEEGFNRTSSNKQDSIPDELQELFKGITLSTNASIYSSNQNYPEEKEIIEKGIAVRWNQIIEQSSKLNSYQDIHKALKTSIGAYRIIFQRKDLFQHLERILEKQKYWSPQEDIINPLTKKKLLKVFRFLTLDSIINDDFKEDKIPIDIRRMSEFEFCEIMNSSFIYSENKEVMVSQDRDTFFCLLLTKKKETMQIILDNFELEGILCNEETSLPWEFNNQEFEELVQKEKEQKNKKEPSNWWTRIFKR